MKTTCGEDKSQDLCLVGKVFLHDWLFLLHEHTLGANIVR